MFVRMRCKSPNIRCTGYTCTIKTNISCFVAGITIIMGIKSLLPKLKEIQQRISVEELAGHAVGIDASTWLYAMLYKYSLDILQKTINPKET